MTNDSHSSLSLACKRRSRARVGHGGPGIQAGYTWSKSIDTTSLRSWAVPGHTGAVTSGFSQNPLDTHAEKAVSNFDVTHGVQRSAPRRISICASVNFLDSVPKLITDGWEMLVMSSINPDRLSRFTPVFSRPEQDRTASIVLTRSPSPSFPRRVKTAQTISDTAAEMVPTTSAFPVFCRWRHRPEPGPASAHSAVTPSAVRLSTTTTSHSSRTRRSGIAPAAPSAWTCSSERSSSTCSIS